MAEMTLPRAGGRDLPKVSYASAFAAPSYDLGFARHLRSLLNIKTARTMDEGGNYPGQLRWVDDDEVLRHLNGDVTYAFSVVNKAKASFAVLDIDAHFLERLPVAADVARRLGFANACFRDERQQAGKGQGHRDVL